MFPLYWGNIYPDRKIKKWEDKAVNVIEKLNETCCQTFRCFPFPFPTFIVEKPQYFDGYRGHTAAQSDSLVKLAHFTGLLQGYINGITRTMMFIPISAWKGQLSKEQTLIRVMKTLGTINATAHGIDAIAMGLYVKGKF